MQSMTDSMNKIRRSRYGQASSLDPTPLQRAWALLEAVPHHVGWISLMAFLAFALFLGLHSGGHTSDVAHRIMSMAGFRIEAVRISGLVELTEQQVVESLEMPEVASLILFDAERARVALEDLSWIKSASVRKIYPGGLDIKIEERRPFAQWQYEGQLSLIDATGAVLTNEDLERFYTLPIIAGEDANIRSFNFLEMLASFETVYRDTAAVILVSKRRWDILFKDGTRILLPERSIINALNWLEKTRSQGNLPVGPIASIDLRVAGKIAIRPKQAGDAGSGAVRDAAAKLEELSE